MCIPKSFHFSLQHHHWSEDGAVILSSSSLDVYHYFLFLHIQDQVVAPLDQLAQLFSVVGFIVVTNEAHYSWIICRLDVISAVLWSTAVGQEGGEHNLVRPLSILRINKSI